jgi:antitoxin VapB
MSIYLIYTMEIFNMQTAKLFQNGRSQAVRLPKEFRFEGESEVFIVRDGERVVLMPTKRPSIELLITALGKFESFPDREQPRQPQTRKAF